jgi:exodeoxyribonuclease V alpha subunit
VHLLAPTGKAAARLRESLLSERGAAWEDDAMWTWLSGLGGSTIHRLLGWQPDAPSRFRHGRSHPCDGDVFVVDEASMVDAALMASLIDAVPLGARLMLLGDRNQLASVSAGSVLADVSSLAGASGIRLPPSRAEVLAEILPSADVEPYVDRSAPAFAGVLVHFRKAFRFRNASLLAPIAALADASAAMSPDEVAEAVARAVSSLEGDAAAGGTPTVRRVEPKVNGGCPEGVLAQVVEAWVDAFGPLCDAPHSEDAQLRAVRALDAQRVLGVHWDGKAGVDALEAAIAGRVLQALHGVRDPEHATGRILMVVENAAEDDLWNGDIGITVFDAASGLDAVIFAAGDGLRRVPRATLPRTVGAFAMTVHKAQGSQFDHAVVVLPDRPSPLLTRELLYTAISRARDRLTVVGTVEVVQAACSRRVQRATSLAGRLVALS